jgi:hypothetical protein
MALGKEGR